MNIRKMELRSASLKDSLLDKEKISMDIISKALSMAKTPCYLFTGEIDSVVALHLIKLLQDGSINFPILHIDTTVEFPEIYQFIEKMQRLWGFQLIRERNDEALRTATIAENKELCCHLMKSEALKKTINKYGIDYLFLAKRRDEKKDPFFSVRGKCALVNPLSYFSDEDIWDYVKKYNLPYCSLYNRYKNFLCVPCTPVFSWAEDTREKDMIEGKEITKKLKALGYL